MIRPATVEDIDFVLSRIRPIDLRELSETCPSDDAKTVLDGVRNAILGQTGLTYCIYDLEPFFIGGLVEVLPWIGQAWAFGTDQVDEYPQEITKQSRRVVESGIEMGFRRIQCDSAAFHTPSHRWLELCGFHRESVKKQFGKNSDFYHYVKNAG